MIVSFICPTRLRPAKLERMVHSVRDTASDPDSYEIVLRVHSDDQQTIAIIPSLLASGSVVVLIGKPLNYAGNRRCFSEALRVAYGDWIWIMNDDVVVSGKGWDKQLSEMPVKHIACPEVHRTGGSTYLKDGGCPFHIYPRELFPQMNGGLWMNGDSELGELSRKMGYGTHFLPGIEVWHDWTPNSKPADPVL